MSPSRIVIATALLGAIAAPGRSHGADARAQLERGRYLVESVAMCQECHTPRDESGNLDRSRWLQGGLHGYRPLKPMAEWADRAPALAGLPGWLDDEDVVYFLENGARRDGRSPRPPMKRFRMHAQDAKAVVAYLRSLKPLRAD